MSLVQSNYMYLYLMHTNTHEAHTPKLEVSDIWTSTPMHLIQVAFCQRPVAVHSFVDTSDRPWRLEWFVQFLASGITFLHRRGDNSTRQDLAQLALAHGRVPSLR